MNKRKRKTVKHTRKDCPYLHIKNCPGCGRTCACYRPRNVLDALSKGHT